MNHTCRCVESRIRHAWCGRCRRLVSTLSRGGCTIAVALLAACIGCGSLVGQNLPNESAGPIDTDSLGQFALSTPGTASGETELQIETGDRKIICTIPREAGSQA